MTTPFDDAWRRAVIGEGKPPDWWYVLLFNEAYNRQSRQVLWSPRSSAVKNTGDMIAGDGGRQGTNGCGVFCRTARRR